MDKPNLNNIPKPVKDYIAYLEGALLGSSELTKELNLSSRAIAQEISIIRESGDILGNDKAFDKILSLIDKASKVKALSEKKEVPIQDEEPEGEKAPKAKLNIQDFVLRS